MSRFETEENAFGSSLRKLRNRGQTPETGDRLTLERFSERLEIRCGLRYSHTAIAGWEKGKHKIDASNRKLLVGILSVLCDCGSVNDRAAADDLLRAGFFSRLTDEECEIISPEWLKDNTANPPYEWTPPSSAPPLQPEQAASFDPLKKLDAFFEQIQTRLSKRGVVSLVLYFFISLFFRWLLLPLLFEVKGDIWWETGQFVTAATAGSLITTFWFGLKLPTLGKALFDSGRAHHTIIGALLGFHIGYLSLFFAAILLKELNLWEIHTTPEIVKVGAMAIVVLLMVWGATRVSQRTTLQDSPSTPIEKDWFLLGMVWTFLWFIPWFIRLFQETTNDFPYQGSVILGIGLILVVLITIYQERKGLQR